MDNENKHPVRVTLKTKEIMDITGWGRDKTQAMLREGKLPNIGSRRRPLVPRQALETYIQNAGSASEK
jgi:excisionase family DNA binding protein